MITIQGWNTVKFGLMNKDKFMGNLRFKDGKAIVDDQIP